MPTRGLTQREGEITRKHLRQVASHSGCVAGVTNSFSNLLAGSFTASQSRRQEASRHSLIPFHSPTDPYKLFSASQRNICQTKCLNQRLKYQGGGESVETWEDKLYPCS